MTAKTLPQTVSIVLVAFNAWDLTRRCLEHLLNASSTLKIEVILVDNGSSDGTPERAEQAFPTVTVLRAGANLGFGRACNLGMTAAQGEFGVFLNNDALLTD
ncbi:MAG: glycosyltransferase, partial [Halioglobus sp.]|nr:glycosyltransferase [Halioglobus sp.]